MARYRKSGSEIIYTDKWKGLDMTREEKKNFLFHMSLILNLLCF